MPNQYGVQIGTCEAVSIIGGQISQCWDKDLGWERRNSERLHLRKPRFGDHL